MENNSYIQAVGRHKRAVARVRLTKGSGKIKINDQEITEPNSDIFRPLKLVGLTNKYDVSIKVSGGGYIGQLKAACLGLARAIAKDDETAALTLKKSGFLTRDSRVKESKKYGLKSARRAPQWSKR